MTGKVTGASRNATSGPIKFPDNGPDKLTGPEITGTLEKRAQGHFFFLFNFQFFNFSRSNKS